MVDEEPGGHAYPALQLPLHAAEVARMLAPYRPPGQELHATAPATLYVPVGQDVAVPLDEPAGHA